MRGPQLHPYRWAVLFAVAAVAALAWDVPLARSSLGQSLAGDVRRVLALSEVFAHGWGVLLIVLTAAVLDPASRPQLVRVSACTFCAGGLAQVVKHVVPRVRPYAFHASGDVFSTFGLGWDAVTAQSAAAVGNPAIQSFPSGHTATAVGLAFGLAWLYPRGRWLFAGFAALAAAQRVQSSAHFLSDTLAAAAIASLVAGVCLSERGPGAWFTRFERSRLRSRATTPESPRAASAAESHSTRRYVA